MAWRHRACWCRSKKKSGGQLLVALGLALFVQQLAEQQPLFAVFPQFQNPFPCGIHLMSSCSLFPCDGALAQGRLAEGAIGFGQCAV